MLKVFPLRSRTRQECLLLPLLLQHCSGGPSHCNKVRKKKKIHGLERKKGNLKLFADFKDNIPLKIQTDLFNY